MRAAIQVPVYDEPAGRLRDTLTSFRAATTEDFEPSYEAWITPSGPQDIAFDVAQECGFETFEAPSGKLSARNAAHSSAFGREMDAVITIDADAPLVAEDAFDRLVREIQSGAVAANAVSVAYKDPEGKLSPLGAVVDVVCLAEDVARPHLSGRCSTISQGAWEQAGPFDDSIDQTDRTAVREEEEFRFYRDVSSVGEVVYADGAKVYNDLRRHVCKLPIGQDCERFESEVTFSPK